MLVLFVSELQYYLTKSKMSELTDSIVSADLSIDAMDVAGEQQLDVEHNLFKQRLDKDLKPVTLEAENTVAGNFHFAPGKSFQQSHVHVHAVEIHDLQSFGLDNINMTHLIKHLSFGKDYPGIVNPLDGTDVTAPQASMMYQYFVKIVPTIYVKTDGEVVKTNQFSVTRHEKVANGLIGDQGLPGVFVLYELSPMMVKFTEKHSGWSHRLTYLPLGSSHPEEDRAGQGVLTVSPAGFHSATQTKMQHRDKLKKRRWRTDRQRSS
ncbi:hypothetical protein INR49_029550 [Caranx melampygus]|nr:hypothetical protein INR49_029550 [Caranx melampygus]